jgi:RNA-directed DNA polymerase
MVWEAYRWVAANKGAPGVDGQALDEFEADLRDNLYRIWNRMSSGSYFPPPVRAVEIPKPHGGGVRVLGVPTISDRIAQTVAAMYLEPLVEPRFHRDSYGYRPNKSALEAVGTCRRRCWEFDWIIDLDVQKFFDTVPWDLVVGAVEAVTDCRWVLLYVKRWLAAPLQRPDGTLVERDKGTPQGSAVSPSLANLFMHFAFDAWMALGVLPLAPPAAALRAPAAQPRPALNGPGGAPLYDVGCAHVSARSIAPLTWTVGGCCHAISAPDTAR